MQGLTHAELVELLIPGDDEEETEAFRQRVLDSFQSQAFGGNQADYREKVLAMDGVGAVKVHAVWNADVSPSALVPGEAVDTWYTGIISSLEEPVAAWLTAVYTAAKNKKLTVGGTVKLVILASDYGAPSPTLIEEIQTAIDPVQNAGEGLGLAPIRARRHGGRSHGGGREYRAALDLRLRVGLGFDEELCGSCHRRLL